METETKLTPLGRLIGANIRRARGRMPVRELSRLMNALGVPMLPSGISKRENEQRSVDADQLVALALALDVTPNRLLLPGDFVPVIRLTPKVTASFASAWEWATGEMPLRATLPWEDGNASQKRVESTGRRFREENQPHKQQADLSALDTERFAPQLRQLSAAVKAAADAGISEADVTAAVRLWFSMHRDTAAGEVSTDG